MRLCICLWFIPRMAHFLQHSVRELQLLQFPQIFSSVLPAHKVPAGLLLSALYLETPYTESRLQCSLGSVPKSYGPFCCLMYSILLNVVSCICLLFVYFWKEGISGLCTSVPYMLFWHHLPLVIQCFAFGFGHSVQCLVSLQISSYSVALWSQIDSLKESLNLTFSQWEKSSFPLCTFPG